MYLKVLTSLYQDGVKETGVSIAYTVREVDAGPVIASQSVEIDDQVKVSMLTPFCPLRTNIHLHFRSW